MQWQIATWNNIDYKMNAEILQVTRIIWYAKLFCNRWGTRRVIATLVESGEKRSISWNKHASKRSSFVANLSRTSCWSHVLRISGRNFSYRRSPGTWFTRLTVFFTIFSKNSLSKNPMTHAWLHDMRNRNRVLGDRSSFPTLLCMLWDHTRVIRFSSCSTMNHFRAYYHLL